MMKKIEKHNCDGFCHEEFCDSTQEFFDIIEVYGLKIHVSLCNVHAQKWNEAWFKDSWELEQIQKIKPLNTRKFNL